MLKTYGGVKYTKIFRMTRVNEGGSRPRFCFGKQVFVCSYLLFSIISSEVYDQPISKKHQPQLQPGITNMLIKTQQYVASIITYDLECCQKAKQFCPFEEKEMWG